MSKIMKKTKFNFGQLILLSIIISFLVFSTFSFMFAPLTGRYENSDELFNIKTSANEMTINTPENKTYGAPMVGYYPGTYGFENDADGNDPTDWNVYEGGGTTCNIINSVGNHSKVVEFDDNSASNPMYLNQTFLGQTNGTIEFWWRTDDASKSIAFSAWNGVTWVISLVLDTNIFRYWNAGWQSTGKSAVSNTWYHISIEFEASTGSYLGLSQYNWRMYIDGTLFGDFNLITNVAQIDMISFSTNPAYTNYKAYVDAIGYTWDQDYSIGDNLNEGLLLSYESSVSLDWIGYSIDGQANRTILGDTTISMPGNGLHSIQVLGNESDSKIHTSKTRYFEIDLKYPELTINFPSQNSYFGNIAPDFNISIIELNLNKSWYTLDNGITNISFTGESGTIDQTEWENLSDGPVTIRFYANDTFGRENYTVVTIIKDSTFPTISINSPSINEVFGGVSPNYNVNITDINLSEIWYTLDNGLTNITFTGQTGTINQTEWDKLSDGQLTIRFYAKDTFKNENYTEASVIKNYINILIITISPPADNELFEIISTNYDILIKEQ